MTLSTRQVTGTYFDATTGTPAKGTVTFTPNTTLLATSSKDIIPQQPVTVSLSGTGTFTANLVPTDTAEITPSGWTYTVAENLVGMTARSYQIFVPSGGTPLDLSTVAPAVSPPAVVQYVLISTVGQVGGPAGPLDSGSHLPSAQVPDLSGTYLTPSAAASTYLASTQVPDASALFPPRNRTPRWVQPSSILTAFQSGHGWTSSGAGATFNLNDTTDFISGSQAAKVTTAGTAAQANIRKFAGSVPDTTGKAIRLRIKVDDITHLNELDFYVGTSSLANAYKWSFFIGGGSTWITSGDWVNITLSFANATVLGTPARSGNTDLQLQVWDDAAGTATVHIQSVELIPDGSTVLPNGLVSVCFDDTYSSPLTQGAFGKMDSYGYPANLMTIVDQVGTVSHLTLQDLKNRVKFGWEVTAHAYTDANHTLTATGMTAAAFDADLRASKAWIVANGFHGSDGYAYPLGQFGKTTDNQATQNYVEKYFNVVRTTQNRTQETFPPANPVRLRAISSITTFAGGTTPTTLTQAGGTIERAKANSAWLVLIFHKIVSGVAAATTECNISDFNSIIDKINTQGMAVETIGSALRYYG